MAGIPNQVVDTVELFDQDGTNYIVNASEKDVWLKKGLTADNPKVKAAKETDKKSDKEPAK